MSLFEDLELPAVLYLPETNAGWMKTLQARWPDLEANMELRDRTIEDLMEETCQFEKALDMLRPLMAHRPERTVAEALELLGGSS
jgi:hypothetical protein